MAKSSKKTTKKPPGKTTSKTKAAAKPVSKGTTKSAALKGAARKPAAKPTQIVKPASKVAAVQRPVPRTTQPPKSKTALTKTDKRVIEGIRPSNGKAASKATGGRPVPRVTPGAGVPGRSYGANPPVVMPVPKPGKNAAGLSNKELEVFRELLLAKRRELVGDMYSMEREALQRSGENLSNLPIHMADMGTDNYEQEFTLGLMEKDRQLLREINAALLKIQNGMYGICEGTGKPISKARLEVQPWARYSIEHARKLESRNFARY